jgi:hypothetical protein
MTSETRLALEEWAKQRGVSRRDDGWLDLRKLGALDATAPLKESEHDKVIFGAGAGQALDLSTLDLSGSGFTRARFVGCTFDHTSFRNCEFFDCDFRYSRLTATSFQESKLARCDFYRAAFTEANIFSKAVLVHVSFDNAWMDGILGLDQSTFRHNRFWRRRYEIWLKQIANKQKDGVEEALRTLRVELETRAPGPVTGQSNGHADLEKYKTRLEKLTSKRGKPATLVQEADELSYFYFLFAPREQRPRQYDLDDGLNDAALQASNTYRALAGLWSGQGQFDDSSFAYVRSKVWERRYLHPRQAIRRHRHRKEEGRDADQKELEREKRNTTSPEAQMSSPPGHYVRNYGMAGLLSWVWLWASGALAKFGEGLGRTVAWVIAVATVPGLLYTWFGAVRDSHDHVVNSVGLGILFSLQQITTLQSDTLKPGNRTVEWIGSLQVLVGIGFLGLVAFVLGNKLRNA